MSDPKKISRRGAVKGIAAGALVPFFPSICNGAIGVKNPIKRLLRETGFKATTFGLGVQSTRGTL